MSEIRKDFDNAFEEKMNLKGYCTTREQIALWAAKWMAERCADSILSVPDRLIIRQLAKELDHE